MNIVKVNDVVYSINIIINVVDWISFVTSNVQYLTLGAHAQRGLQ